MTCRVLKAKGHLVGVSETKIIQAAEQAVQAIKKTLVEQNGATTPGLEPY